MQGRSIEETIEFIKHAHEGQVDKAGNEYWKHPVAVMGRLPEGVDIEVKLAALLHDVLEDAPYTRQQLSDMGYSSRTLDAVELVTQKEGDTRSYAEKIDAIIASGNKDAIQLKRADMLENTDPERLALLRPDVRKRLEDKYRAPIQLLHAALA